MKEPAINDWGVNVDDMEATSGDLVGSILL